MALDDDRLGAALADVREALTMVTALHERVSLGYSAVFVTPPTLTATILL